MTSLPPPRDLGEHVGRLVRELADHLAELPYLTGLSFEPGSPRRDPAVWDDYWVRTWGARGLLYVWDETASGPVVAGLSAEHWRPAEMCLKVATRREVGGAGDGAATLSTHALPRVRRQAGRALGRLATRLDLVGER